MCGAIVWSPFAGCMHMTLSSLSSAAEREMTPFPVPHTPLVDCCDESSSAAAERKMTPCPVPHKLLVECYDERLYHRYVPRFSYFSAARACVDQWERVVSLFDVWGRCCAAWATRQMNPPSTLPLLRLHDMYSASSPPHA